MAEFGRYGHGRCSRLRARLAKRDGRFEMGGGAYSRDHRRTAQRVTAESHQWGRRRGRNPSQSNVPAARAMRTSNEGSTAAVVVQRGWEAVYLRAVSSLLRCSCCCSCSCCCCCSCCCVPFPAAECPLFVPSRRRPHHPPPVPSHLATATRRATTTAPHSILPGASRRPRKQRAPRRLHCVPSDSARFLLCVAAFTLPSTRPVPVPRALRPHLEG
jgi:hypothetical protein